MLLKSRDGEIEGLRSELEALRAQLTEMGSVREQSEALPQEELSKENGSRVEELEESLRRVQALESLLRQKEDLLKTHDGKIKRLESDLKEKRTELARYEIGVWQSV